MKWPDLDKIVCPNRAKNVCSIIFRIGELFPFLPQKILHLAKYLNNIEYWLNISICHFFFYSLKIALSCKIFFLVPKINLIVENVSVKVLMAESFLLLKLLLVQQDLILPLAWQNMPEESGKWCFSTQVCLLFSFHACHSSFSNCCSKHERCETFLSVCLWRRG
jgi:hypothetical protein